MEFAIVDIETTGGHAAGNCITEVAIFIHNGERVTEHFESLVNPNAHIPYYITALTGITNEMVSNAPEFSFLAKRIFELLNGRVFIAHAVNFDYSFLTNTLNFYGFELKCRKLCTVRLSRKVFPGLPSYSLGNLCSSLDIPLFNRHRAGGDAKATVKIFEKILKEDREVIFRSLKKGSKEQALPPNLPREEYEQLPHLPGVYYFLNKKGKVIYVGKAADIKKRITAHFSNNSPAKQKGEFMRHVFHFHYTVCASESVALALETKEIKRLWPSLNRAQKGYTPVYGIISYIDQSGYFRMAIKKIARKTEIYIPVQSVIEGHDVLRSMASEHSLCLRLSGISKSAFRCKEEECVCHSESIEQYNKRAFMAMEKTNVSAKNTAWVETPEVYKKLSISLF